jgi:hypothetical protein
MKLIFDADQATAGVELASQVYPAVSPANVQSRDTFCGRDSPVLSSIAAGFAERFNVGAVALGSETLIGIVNNVSTPGSY